MTDELETLYLPALKGRVGTWAFYSTLMKFSEVSARMNLSKEIYQNRNLSEMVQRAITTSRVDDIEAYLNSESERFLPGMVVAVYGGAPDWLEVSIDGADIELEIDTSELDLSKLDSFGILRLRGDEQLFPLDGQHRFAGIRQAVSTPRSNQDHLPDDEIMVTLVAHEKTEKGRIRSRRLFTVLNKRAVPVQKHETIALDEDDVMAICTRYLVECFDPLTTGGLVSFRTNASIAPNNHREFTTIVTLYDILADLFRGLTTRTSKELRFNRPTDEWMDVYIGCAHYFFGQMGTIFPEVEECWHHVRPEEVITRCRRDDGGHVLFRPIGQRLLGRLVSEYARRANRVRFEDGRISATDAKELAFESLGAAFLTFAELPTELSEKPYVNLIWESSTRRMRVQRATLLRDVILRRYGIGEPDRLHGLDGRLKSALGGESSVRDFLW